jgi:hypothetical protein
VLREFRQPFRRASSSRARRSAPVIEGLTAEWRERNNARFSRRRNMVYCAAVENDSDLKSIRWEFSRALLACEARLRSTVCRSGIRVA